MKRLLVSLTGIAGWMIVAGAVLAQPPAFEGKQGGRGGPPGPMPFGPPRVPVMTAIDGNGDGELSAEEIAKAPEALKKLDKNGDGKLSREELRPQFAPPGGPGGPGGSRGPGAGGGRGGMAQGGMGQGGRASATLESLPRPKDDAENKTLKLIEEIAQKQGRMLNVPAQDGRMLRLLAETADAKQVVEIGTSNGISAIWFGMALRKTGGKLITHEIDAGRAALARENFASAGITDLVTVVEGDAHETVAKLTGPIDLVFIDADKEGYLDYLKKLLPLVRPGGLVLAHNMNPRMAEAGFVKAITTNPDLETLFYTEAGGLSISLKKR